MNIDLQAGVWTNLIAETGFLPTDVITIAYVFSQNFTAVALVDDTADEPTENTGTRVLLDTSPSYLASMTTNGKGVGLWAYCMTDAKISVYKVGASGGGGVAPNFGYSPVGSPHLWCSSVIPSGWAIMNGASFDTTRYPELAKVFPSGDLPDFRGMFPRGLDLGRGVDTGRVLLSQQGDAIRNITINMSGVYGETAIIQPDSDSLTTSQSSFIKDGFSTSWDRGGFFFDASKQVPTATENRPINIAVNFIVELK